MQGSRYAEKLYLYNGRIAGKSNMKMLENPRKLGNLRNSIDKIFFQLFRKEI